MKHDLIDYLLKKIREKEAFDNSSKGKRISLKSSVEKWVYTEILNTIWDTPDWYLYEAVLDYEFWLTCYLNSAKTKRGKIIFYYALNAVEEVGELFLV